jgi:hypothetical protein
MPVAASTANCLAIGAPASQSARVRRVLGGRWRGGKDGHDVWRSW